MGGWSSSRVASLVTDWPSKDTSQRRNQWWGPKSLLEWKMWGESYSESETFLSLCSRFQLQVALYIAASLGHLDLADWLLENGTHAGEPVGVHPYRQWCHQTAHQDTGKCPVHKAAECNQLLILKLFITKNLLTLACQDPTGRNPLKVALHCGHRNCVRYLANKLCSVVSLPNVSLPMRVYLQIKRWVSLGQKRAAASRYQDTSAACKASVGDPLLIDGFNQPNMSSKYGKVVGKPNREIKPEAFQPLPPIRNIFSVSHLSKTMPPQLSSLQSVSPGGIKQTQGQWKQGVRSGENVLLYKIRKQGSSSCTDKFILPSISSIQSKPRMLLVGASPKPSHVLEYFSHHCGRGTPRQNAIYCLTIARSLCFVLYVLMCTGNLFWKQ